MNLTDERGSHQVEILRFMGGYIVRVDGEPVNDGEVYHDKRTAVRELVLAWGEAKLDPKLTTIFNAY